MVVIDYSRLSAGRDYLAALKVQLAVQRISNKFIELLRSQELIQDHALRPSDLRQIQNTYAVTLAVFRSLQRGYAQWPRIVLGTQSSGRLWRLRWKRSGRRWLRGARNSI